MLRRPPGSTRTDTLFPYTTLFRSLDDSSAVGELSGELEEGGVRVKVDHRVTVHNPMTDAQPAMDHVRLLVEKGMPVPAIVEKCGVAQRRSEEHTSELQSLMRISYAVFCLKKKKQQENKLINMK